MFNYETFDEIFQQFKKTCDENLSEVIGLNQKYTAGRYETKLFLCDTYKTKADATLDFLNRKIDENGAFLFD